MVFEWPRVVPWEAESQAPGFCIVCGQPLPVEDDTGEAQSAVGECFLCAEHGREHLLEWTSVSKHGLFSTW